MAEKKASVYHMYHRGFDGQVIFYCAIDRLVYYSLCSILSRKFGVKILSLAEMFTHTHQLGVVSSLALAKSYEYQVGWYYARAFNEVSKRKGALFARSAGFALKRTEKDIRTSLAYLANNSYEKQLVRHCWEDRWNFVAFANSPSPYSDPLVRKRASTRLRHALRIVEVEAAQSQFLNHRLLFRLFSGLSPAEVQQLIDAIIVIYGFIDYDAVIRFYGSYEKMILSFDANTGSEYGLKEVWEPPSDLPYRQMCRIVRGEGYSLLEKDFLRSIPDELILALMRGCNATPYQIRRFLHLPDPVSSP